MDNAFIRNCTWLVSGRERIWKRLVWINIITIIEVKIWWKNLGVFYFWIFDKGERINWWTRGDLESLTRKRFWIKLTSPETSSICRFSSFNSFSFSSSLQDKNRLCSVKCILKIISYLWGFDHFFCWLKFRYKSSNKIDLLWELVLLKLQIIIRILEVETQSIISMLLY